MLPNTEPGQRRLFYQIIRFSQALHNEGISVNSGNLIDFCSSLAAIDIGNKTDFYAAARATLVSSQAELPVFDRIFREFWQARDQYAHEEMTGEDDSEEFDADPASGRPGEQLELRMDANRDDASTQSYSPWHLLMKKDLGELSDREMEKARIIVRELVALLANVRSRRRVASRHGKEINARQLLRQEARYGSDNTELVYRERRVGKTRLLLLCDVSGSMKRYSQFLIQFIYAMRQQLSGLDVAVFSTKMTEITDLLSTQSVDKSLWEVADAVHDWSGGTNIGNSLREFNERYADHLDQRRTVVIILSDGWDRGDAGLMGAEMASLYRHTKKLIWLNPLMSSSSYQPLCRGMQTALPFIDNFLSAHNLESLANLIRLLRMTLRK